MPSEGRSWERAQALLAVSRQLSAVKDSLPELQPLSSAAAESCRGGPGPATPVSASLTRSCWKGWREHLLCTAVPATLQKEMVCGVREAHTKKKKVYIFINAKINISDRIPNPSNMCAITLQTARRTASGAQGEKQWLHHRAASSTSFSFPDASQAWEGGGRASNAERQHATVLERNVMV